MYAVGSEHQYKAPCQRLIRAIASGEILATTTAEVIQELTNVRARRRDQADAAALARDYIELLSPLLAVEEADLREGLRMFEETAGAGAFDAVLASAAHAIGADALVSADRGYAGMSAVRHVVPDDNGIRGLLQHPASGPSEDS